MSSSIVLAEGVRTAMADYNGLFADTAATDLAVAASQEAMRRARFEPGEIGHVIFGAAFTMVSLRAFASASASVAAWERTRNASRVRSGRPPQILSHSKGPDSAMQARMRPS